MTRYIGTLLLFFIGFFSCISTQAQQDNRHCRWVKADAAFMVIPDTQVIIPESIYLAASHPSQEKLHDFFKLHYQPNQKRITLLPQAKAAIIPLDSILICYRILPASIANSYYKRSETAYDTGYYSSYTTTLPIGQAVTETGNLEREELFTLKGVGTEEGFQKTGSLSRGISFGSGGGQDVGVTSALNLQLEGKLTPDLTLTAVITDQNVPFQPEGNTQQLQDFDQVLIQLKHKKGSLSAGDIILQHDTSSYFLRYYKNVQGAQLHTYFGDSSKWKSHSSIGISAAKGQFHADSVAVLEGVLGPYRLRGANGERFITILANSERVFLDGKRLERGFDFDYVIDYNTAEITFTNQVLITKFSRVRVDFEYATQNYSRSILQAQHRQQYKKWNFSFQFYRERDNVNSPLLAQLSEADREILTNAGDNTQLAVAPAIREVESFDVNQILYRQVQQEINGITYTFFERALNENAPLFSLTFSEVGIGIGNYIEGDPTANGREYVWVPPINGVPQGSFEPVRQLPAPNQRQVMSLRTSYAISKNEQVYAEAAFSLQDQNLFSKLDAADNQGNALKVGYRHTGKKSKRWKDYKWFGTLSLELNQQHFQGIDRFRSIEFDRDWALENREASADLIAIGQIGLTKNQKNHFDYQLTHRQRGTAANGFQHQLTANKSIGNLQLSTTGFILNSIRDTTIASWQKFQGTAAWETNKLVVGYDFQLDKNSIQLKDSDIILRSLMNFAQHQAFIHQGDSSSFNFRAAYHYRTDFIPISGSLATNTISQTTNLSFQKPSKTGFSNFTFTYRILENFQTTATSRFEETIMGRFDWKRSFAQKRIRSNFSISTSAGRELKREFFFLPVDVGQGTHTWRDDNNDGIQDLNEFYEAINLEERQFAKFFQPTDEYILAFNTLLNYQLHLQTPKSWIRETGWKKFATKFSSINTFRISKRTTDTNPIRRISPFLGNIADEDLISNRSTIRSVLFFNRRNPKFGAEAQFLSNNSKQLLTSGFQANSLQEYQVQFRLNFNKIWSGELNLAHRSKTNLSDVLQNQNFDVRTYEWAPSIAYQPKRGFRLTGQYQLKLKNNQIDNQESANLHELSLQLRLAKKVRNVWNAQFKFIQINYDGAVNTGVGYELLEALQPGSNFRWELRWSQRLNNGLQINAIYNGRKSFATDIIHVGRVQATALF